MNKVCVLMAVLLLTGCETLDRTQEKCLDHPMVCTVIAATCMGLIGVAVKGMAHERYNYNRERCIFNEPEGTYCP